MKFNIIPLKGKKDSYPKNDSSKFPKWKGTDFYTSPIPDDVNTMMMTGVHPIYSDIQIVVLDYDGPSHKKVDWNSLTDILHHLKRNNLEPYMIRRTGNGGFHLIFICDIEVIFRNEHNRGLNDDAITLFDGSVGDIDVRANGGLVFWDCKFSDTDNYFTVYESNSIDITSSSDLKDYINSLRKEELEKSDYSFIPVSSETKPLEDSINITMENCTEYGIPIKHYHKFNSLKQATKDIWLGRYIITKSNNEFRKWGIFWRDCLASGIPQYIVLDRLRSGIQPEYDEADTIGQLGCLKYKDKKPSYNYYYKVFPSYSKY